MDDQILMDNSVPVNIKFMPAQIEILLRGMGELPFKVAQPIIESIINQCREQSAKPEKEDEPAKP